MLWQNDCTHKITTKKNYKTTSLFILFSTYDNHESIMWRNMFVQLHGIPFGLISIKQYIANWTNPWITGKHVAGIWLIHVHINIVNIYGHTMYIQEIYCFQSQHFSQYTTNLNRTLSVPVTMITWATINLVTLAFVSAKFHHSDAGVCWLGFPQFLPFYQPSQHIVEQSVHALPRGGGSLIVSIKPA